MVICDRQGELLLLTLSPEGVRFLREQWSWLRELVRWQLAGCTDDPLAQVTGLPVPIGAIDGRLAYVVDYWCGTKETGPVRQLWEGWVLHDLEHSLTRVLSTLPRHGGVVQLPGHGYPSAAEWGWMLETLHVVLDVSGRVSITGSPDRILPPAPSAQDTESYRRSLRWLEMVIDALAQAQRPTPADSPTDNTC
ncbi:MAG: hypothetical protein QOH09_4940 [Pseudonocardiales bacterium]|jgi:hypothetical protein|nr:hypothetical protein [Pseudonocardiales bacterium]MDT7718948.1 hypothetical protein [Pseudonocardiales bacterium]HZD14855.1 hypothetical protein [Pseudonocardiaceae bacterium]